MQETKEDIIKIIDEMLYLNDSLHPFLFNQDNVMLDNIRKHLLMISEHAKKDVFSFFSDIEQIDILLGGSICSYTWNDTSDLNIFVITNNVIAENNKLSMRIFSYLSQCSVYKNLRPAIYGHPIDVEVLPVGKYMHYYAEKTPPCELYSYGTYSIFNNKWLSEPIKGQYPFNANDLYQNYLKLDAELKDFVNVLEKTPDGFLTLESQGKLRNKIANIKREAFLAKEHDDLHEYTLNYCTYRIAKKLNFFDPYFLFINNSHKELIGGNDGRND